MVTFCIKHIGNRNIFLPPPPPEFQHILSHVCTLILHNINASWDSGGGGMIIHSPNVTSERARTFAVGYLVFSLENLFFQYNEIISTSKLPFHNTLVMKYYNVLAYFSLDYDNCPFTKFSW